jgi:cyclopropane fatty-acyl-phospholipid synthase-like methyltransferase
MTVNVHKIKDECRKNLLKYTERALSLIPDIDNPVILDMGCGTGVPTILLAERFNGTIYAVDIDTSSLEVLKEKIAGLHLHRRIQVVNDSLVNLSKLDTEFDIILAEGILNIAGFTKGLKIFTENLAPSGYLIIHDEYAYDPEKRDLFKKNKLDMVDLFILDKKIWWDEYYSCLEERIIKNSGNSSFTREINEINEYKNKPEKFESVFYILKKRRYYFNKREK